MQPTQLNNDGWVDLVTRLGVFLNDQSVSLGFHPLEPLPATATIHVHGGSLEDADIALGDVWGSAGVEPEVVPAPGNAPMHTSRHHTRVRFCGFEHRLRCPGFGR